MHMGSGVGKQKRIRKNAEVLDTPQEEYEQLVRNTIDCLPEGALLQKIQQACRTNTPLRIKLGIDPTAPDIHLGHVVVLNKLREFQNLGHTVVLIIGDFTTRIGDPSGRDKTRPLISEAEIKENANKFQEQAFKVLDPEKTEIKFNSQWLEMPSKEILNLLSSITVARLIERKDFKERLGANKPLSVLEMLYPILQAYDSVVVDADVEVGGTDQKFNLLMGRNLQEAQAKQPQVILTMPILRGTDGTKKMSKSEGNYVGINDSPEEMYGKIMSIPDELTSEYSELVLDKSILKETSPLAAKKSVAAEIVKTFHGDNAATDAAEHFVRVHKEKKVSTSINTVRISAESLRGNKIHLPALISASFNTTNSAARRLIEQRGVKIDGKLVPLKKLDFQKEDLINKIIQVGPRRFRKIVE